MRPERLFAARDAGVNGAAHGMDGTVDVAVEFAEVGDAGVRGDAGAQINHLLGGVDGFGVAS